MTYLLTHDEIEDLLKTSVYIDNRIADIYTDYLIDAFGKIDAVKTTHNDNVGRKGEVLVGCILDITLWRFNYALLEDYTIKPQVGGDPVTKQGGIDFKLDLQGDIFLCESKNLGANTYIDKRFYTDNIKDRFTPKGINILCINEDKISSVKKFSTIDNLDINFITLYYFMNMRKNIRSNIKDNLNQGCIIFTEILQHYMNENHHNNPYKTKDCVSLGMPTWFIKQYRGGITDRAITKATSSYGIDRKQKPWLDATEYRNILL